MGWGITCFALIVIGMVTAARGQYCPGDVNGDGLTSAADVTAVVQSSATCSSVQQSVTLLERLADGIDFVTVIVDTGDVIVMSFDFFELTIDDDPFLSGSDPGGTPILVQASSSGGMPYSALIMGDSLCDLVFFGFVTADSDLLGGVDYGLAVDRSCTDEVVDGPNPTSATLYFAGPSSAGRRAAQVSVRNRTPSRAAGVAASAARARLVAAWNGSARP